MQLVGLFVSIGVRVCLEDYEHVVWVCCKDLERRDRSSLFWGYEGNRYVWRSLLEVGDLHLLIFLFSISINGFLILICSFIALVEFCCWVFIFWDKGLNLLIVMWFWVLGFDDWGIVGFWWCEMGSIGFFFFFFFCMRIVHTF